MKLIQFVLASKVSGGYYQKWKHLSATEKTERQVTCDAKTEETKAAFVIENGAWNCPNLGLTRPRVVCDPTCLPGYEPNWTDGSISKPKKDHPRFMTRCGNPANIAKRYLFFLLNLAYLNQKSPVRNPARVYADSRAPLHGHRRRSHDSKRKPFVEHRTNACKSDFRRRLRLGGDHGRTLLQQRLVSFLEKSRIRNCDQRLRR